MTPHQSSRFSIYNKAQFKESIVRHLRSSLATSEQKASPDAWWRATASAINELIFEHLAETQQRHSDQDARAVHYFSMEFLMGTLMSNNLHNLGLFQPCVEALDEMGISYTDLLDQEPDMALGNGGLGRLAACFLDSLATLDFPAIGYGIRYEHGLFRQEIRDGHQIERPDAWREYGNPWEICRPELVQEIPLYGYVESSFSNEGNLNKVWHPSRKIKGVPWDIPVVGYGASTVNVLRLWESRPSEFFDWDVFSAGGYVDSQAEKAHAETISKVLYPNDDTEAGKELRLIQQYFFCACSLKDILRRYKRHHPNLSGVTDKIVIQLNDTHPAISIPELQRILVDEEKMDWSDAWSVCQRVFAYTNHTLLPEALETWPVYLFEKVLPRHLEIIYEINRRFLGLVEQKWPDNDAVKRKLSIISDDGTPVVRMANLSVVCSFKVNGVAQIHSDLVKKELFPEFDTLYPEKLCNVTNGVTPRRWLLACNPELAQLLNETVGTAWPMDLNQLKRAADFADDSQFQSKFMAIKQRNKEKLAKIIEQETGILVSADAIFDVQIKRLHEYKRQHLNLLYIMTLYRRLLADSQYDCQPRVFIFGAKAAPGYALAKEIIYTINKVAERINADPRIQGKIKVVFLPNYRVSLAESIIPAADVSEQISTAGKEASGTGNMKLSLNGAITLGTLDGANIEIEQEVGSENCCIFGLTVPQVRALREQGYRPQDYYYGNDELKAILDWLDTDYFTPGKPGALSSLKKSLLDGGDPYLVLVDYAEYCTAQGRIDALYRQSKQWARMAIMNTACMGKFTSDRSIQDYVARIWQLKPVPLPEE